MIIYKDCFTGRVCTILNYLYKLPRFSKPLLGDELFSDSYKVKTVDEVFYEVEGKASILIRRSLRRESVGVSHFAGGCV